MAINDVVNTDGSLNYSTVGGFKDRLDGHDSSLAQIAYNVKNFGAKGDGVTDDTQSIKNAVSTIQANGGGTLYFPSNFNCLVSVTADSQSIFQFSNINVIVEMNQSKVTLKPNQYQHYNVFSFVNCNNFIIRNGSITGDRLNHDYTTVSGTHEWGYGIYSSGCKGIIDNVHVSQCTGDGIFIIDSFTSTWGQINQTSVVTVKNSEIDHCRRQGITIEDSDTTKIDNCHIHHIGTWDGVNGTAPMSGIDLEFEYGTSHANLVKIMNTQIDNCTNYAITGSNPPQVLDELDISNCVLLGTLSIYIVTTLKINNTRMDSASPSYISNVIAQDCIFNLAVNSSLQINGDFFHCEFNGTIDGTSGQSSTLETDSKNANLRDCSINNMHGTISFTVGSLTGYMNGIYKYNNLSNFSFYKCTFINTNFYGRDTTSTIQFIHCSFENCYIIWNGTQTQNFYNCYFHNCLGSADWNPTFVLSNCTIINDNNNDLFGQNTKNFKNCTIILTGTYNQRYTFRGLVYNSYMEINGLSGITLQDMSLYGCTLKSSLTSATLTATNQNCSVIN